MQIYIYGVSFNTYRHICRQVKIFTNLIDKVFELNLINRLCGINIACKNICPQVTKLMLTYFTTLLLNVCGYCRVMFVFVIIMFIQGEKGGIDSYFAFLFSAMDQVMQFVDPAKTFAKDSIRLVKRCTKPDRKGKTENASITGNKYLFL